MLLLKKTDQKAEEGSAELPCPEVGASDRWSLGRDQAEGSDVHTDNPTPREDLYPAVGNKGCVSSCALALGACPQ